MFLFFWDRRFRLRKPGISVLRPFLPPAKQGDILSLVCQKKPRAIALIDGFFHQSLSVWHREILYALDKGVAVVGASSMGALRAAELDLFGMQGMGKIYEMYRDRQLTDDDEVVLMHGPQEAEYLNLSLPMINIRFTLERARAGERITPSECDEWLSAFKSLYYPKRTIFMIPQIARERMFAQESAERIQRIFEQEYVDQKREDALLLLKTLAAGSIQRSSVHFTFNKNPLFNELYQTERRVCYKDQEFTLAQLAKHVAIHHPRFSDLYFSVAFRALSALLAKMLGIEVEPEKVDEEKKLFCKNRQCDEPELLKEWLERNHLEEEEFHTLMQERAEARKIFQSLCIGHVSAKWTQRLLQELKLSNQYEEWMESLAIQEEILKREVPGFDEMKHAELSDISSLFASHLRESTWNLDRKVEEWLEDAGFIGAQELAGHVLRSQKSHEVLKNKMARLFSSAL